MIHPVPEKGGRGKVSAAKTAEKLGGFSNDRLNQARTVLRWAPELADNVLSGAESLDRAYAIAGDRKLRAEGVQMRLKKLRAIDPDLADKVVEDQLSLEDAEGAARARRENERASRQGTYDCNEQMQHWTFLTDGANRDYLVKTCREHPDEISKQEVLALFKLWIKNLTLTVKGLEE
jgi:hypothetical protein